jgi:hypothetical protein
LAARRLLRPPQDDAPIRHLFVSDEEVDGHTSREIIER